MCGRFVVAGERDDLLRLFEIEVVGEGLPERSWNVRPTDRVQVVVESIAGDDPPVRRLESARWSLTPSFASTLAAKFPTFNARSETAADKPFFAPSVRSRRALIPASGYYEWVTDGREKTPYYIHAREGLLAFAGLYSWWRDQGAALEDPARWVLTTTILTRAAVAPLDAIHDRAPVVLPPEWWDDWLDPTLEGDGSLAAAASEASMAVAADLVMHEVRPIRGDDRPEMILPA